MGQIRIGISGWTYGGWRGQFYPEKLPRARELEYAAQQFSTIEINGSFYSLQRPSSYSRWYDSTPERFVFAIKSGRFITHVKRLRDVDAPVANFFASGVLGLREKSGPFLWQLPPTLKYDAETMRQFLSLLPRTTHDAVTLAKRHDRRLSDDRVLTSTDYEGTLRHAIEPRHLSFCNAEFIELLREHKVALVFSNAPKPWPDAEDLTADFVYMRLHGDTQMYGGNYPDESLKRFADRIQTWREGKQPRDAHLAAGTNPPKLRSRDVFVYFDNDQKAKAPEDARRLMDLV